MEEKTNAARSFIGRREAAAILGVTPRTVDKYLAAGRLRAVKLGGKWRFDRADLARFVASCANTPGPVPEAGAERLPEAPPGLEPDCFLEALGAVERDELPPEELEQLEAFERLAEKYAESRRKHAEAIALVRAASLEAKGLLESLEGWAASGRECGAALSRIGQALVSMHKREAAAPSEGPAPRTAPAASREEAPRMERNAPAPRRKIATKLSPD